MTLRSATEADLEARVHAAMIAVFPWIDAQDLAHQFSFSIKLGRGTLDIDGRKNLQISGRSDILVFVKGVPLVLMELKREGETLTEEDVRQGLSYARVTTPPTPLVMVSNGQETRIHVSYTGEVWVPTERTEQELARRITAVGQIASSDLNEAVSTLLGSGQGHWVKAFRAVSLGLIEDRTGGWAEPFAPFVRGFLIPRRATKRVAAAFRKGARAVVIHGPPLSGKSNVLRDFYERTQALASIGLLILEPSGHGLFQAIANVLSSELGWKLTADDTREWIRAVSLESNSTLVLAVDGIAPENSALLADLNEIATNRFGTAVRLLVTVDDSALDGVTKKRSGREGNAFGRAAHEIPLLPLDDMEFETAKKALAGNRISITRGGESVLSMREPWILRALVPEDLAELPMEPSQLVVRIPPMIDVESLDKATGAIGEGAEIETALRGAASAILDEYLETRNLMQVLQGISTYAVDKRRLEKEIGDLAIGELREKGFLKLGIDWAERPVWFVRVPLLVARHIAIVLVERMREWGEPDEVAKRLIAISSKLPIGDVICAYAMLVPVEY